MPSEIHTENSVKDKYKIMYKNSYASTLRDIADYDYISARLLLRNHCKDQFLYLAYQSLEKYMKSILLFHLRKNKIGHDITKLFGEICKITEFEIGNNPRIKTFIERFDNTFGDPRYLSLGFAGDYKYLFELDYAVWKLRIYCQPERNRISLLEKADEKILKKSFLKGTFLLWSGVLEDVHKEKKKGLYQSLVWFNSYFGRFKGNEMSLMGYWFKNSPLFSGNEERRLLTYESIKDYVHIPPKIKNYFEDLKKRNS